MSNAIEYAQNGNINGLQEEIRRNPNAVHVKSGVRVIIYIYIPTFFIKHNNNVAITLIITIIIIYIPISQYGNTPLIVAADRGHLEAVRLLLATGADINCKNIVSYYYYYYYYYYHDYYNYNYFYYYNYYY